MARDRYQRPFVRRVVGRLRSTSRAFYVGVFAVAVVVGVLVALPRGGRHSATLHGWSSGDVVGLRGYAGEACATAFPPWSGRLDADQFIICSGGSQYVCYRQRMHAIKKPVPIRRSVFDSECRAALAVLRKAALSRYF
jgi:hypothetical protein